MMTTSLALAFSCAATASAVGIAGSKIFQWSFDTTSGFSTDIPSCQTFPIQLEPYNTSSTAPTDLGKPPYFMLAFAVGGTPRLYSIGSDPKNLSWASDFPFDTELLLSVIDSNNTSGGTPPNTYKAVAGQTSNCIKPAENATTASFTVSSNITNSSTCIVGEAKSCAPKVETCAPWGVTVKGGIAPYTWTIAQVGSPVITNVTGTGKDDEMVYINRGDVGIMMIAAASDLTGQWATGTPFIMPHGSTNVDCTGLVTVTGNSTILSKPQSPSSSSSNKTAIIAGAVAGVVALLLLLGAAYAFVRRRRHRKNKHERARPFDIDPKLGGEYEPHYDYGGVRPSAVVSKYSTAPSDPGSSSAGRPGSSSAGRPGSSSASAGQMSPTREMPMTPMGGSVREETPEEEIVIQHRDGGAPAVHELPPPYASHARSARRTSKP